MFTDDRNIKFKVKTALAIVVVLIVATIFVLRWQKKDYSPSISKITTKEKVESQIVARKDASPTSEEKALNLFHSTKLSHQLLAEHLGNEEAQVLSEMLADGKYLYDWARIAKMLAVAGPNDQHSKIIISFINSNAGVNGLEEPEDYLDIKIRTLWTLGLTGGKDAESFLRYAFSEEGSHDISNRIKSHSTTLDWSEKRLGLNYTIQSEAASGLLLLNVKNKDIVGEFRNEILSTLDNWPEERYLTAPVKDQELVFEMENSGYRIDDAFVAIDIIDQFGLIEYKNLLFQPEKRKDLYFDLMTKTATESAGRETSQE